MIISKSHALNLSVKICVNVILHALISLLCKYLPMSKLALILVQNDEEVLRLPLQSVILHLLKRLCKMMVTVKHSKIYIVRNVPQMILPAKYRTVRNCCKHTENNLFI